MTKCLYSRKGIPWLRFSSLVRSVMSVCSSAKPYTKRPTDGESPVLHQLRQAGTGKHSTSHLCPSCCALVGAEAVFPRSSTFPSGFNHQTAHLAPSTDRTFSASGAPVPQDRTSADVERPWTVGWWVPTPGMLLPLFYEECAAVSVAPKKKAH